MQTPPPDVRGAVAPIPRPAPLECYGCGQPIAEYPYRTALSSRPWCSRVCFAVQRGQRLSPKGIEARLHDDATLDGLWYDVNGPYAPRCVVCDAAIPTRAQRLCMACADELPPVMLGQGEYERGYTPEPVHFCPTVLQWVAIFGLIWAVVLVAVVLIARWLV